VTGDRQTNKQTTREVKFVHSFNHLKERERERLGGNELPTRYVSKETKEEYNTNKQLLMEKNEY